MKSVDKKLLELLPKHIVVHIEHLERMRSDFVANVSHELRTPLTVIRGYLESLLVLKNQDIGSLEKIFAQMYQHCLRMEHLIEDLLLLSHLESDEQKPKTRKKIRVAQLLTSICADAKSLSGQRQHHIRLTADSNLVLDGIESELKSLFSNIIFNAVKYTPSKGHIDVKWCRQRGQAVFRVHDTGIGIAKKHIPRITERFYRIDKARSRESGGTGLGLAIAKHVLIRHQATLEVESQLGKGSTFTCVFPKERTSIIKK